MFKEFKNFSRFFDKKNEDARTLVFYSEKAIDYQYHQGLINAVLNNSNLNISYVTSDSDDPVLNGESDRIKAFYIKNSLKLFFSKLDSKILVMTMPDLNQMYIKKMNKNTNYIYTFHSIISTHMQYRLGAFDHYDTIFSVGPHHLKEIRETESLYNLKAKNLINFGYPRLEKIYNDHQVYLERNPKNKDSRKTILIAPTWGDNCILATCIKDIISHLKNSEYEVFIRPHPEFLKNNKKTVNKIGGMIKDINNIRLETNLLSDINIHEADLLITDWSGIALEYAFGTERPVLFIDTPKKINNPEYKKITAEPITVTLRNKVGESLPLERINEIKNITDNLIDNKENFKEEVIKNRKKYIFNWMNSSKIGADYILNYLKINN